MDYNLLWTWAPLVLASCTIFLFSIQLVPDSLQLNVNTRNAPESAIICLSFELNMDHNSISYNPGVDVLFTTQLDLSSPSLNIPIFALPSSIVRLRIFLKRKFCTPYFFVLLFAFISYFISRSVFFILDLF